MENVDKLGKVPTDPGTEDPSRADRPLEPVVIEKATIRES